MEVKFIDALSEFDTEQDGTLHVLLPAWGAPEPEAFFEECGQAAAKGGCLVCPPFVREGYVSMAFFGPGGAVVQDACFLPPHLGEYKKGGDVLVFDTALGRLALAAGLDALQPQYARLAALKGCRLLVCSLWATGREYLMAGPWSAAQANCMAVAAAMPGAGRLVLPCALTADGSGFGRGGFSPEELARAYKDFPVFDCLNPALYRRYQKELLR